MCGCLDLLLRSVLRSDNDQRVHVDGLVGHLTVEVGHFLEAHLLDEMLHDGLLQFYLAVLELPLYHFLGKQALFHLRLLQGQTYFGFSTARLHDVEPLLAGLLVR